MLHYLARGTTHYHHFQSRESAGTEARKPLCRTVRFGVEGCENALPAERRGDSRDGAGRPSKCRSMHFGMEAVQGLNKMCASPVPLACSQHAFR